MIELTWAELLVVLIFTMLLSVSAALSVMVMVERRKGQGLLSSTARGLRGSCAGFGVDNPSVI